MKQKELFLNKYKIDFYFRKSVFQALNMKIKFIKYKKSNQKTLTKTKSIMLKDNKNEKKEP